MKEKLEIRTCDRCRNRIAINKSYEAYIELEKWLELPSKQFKGVVYDVCPTCRKRFKKKELREQLDARREQRRKNG